MTGPRLARITRILCRINQRSQRAFSLALGDRPVQAIVAPKRAHQARGVDPAAVCLLEALEIIVLSICAGEQCTDR